MKKDILSRHSMYLKLSNQNIHMENPQWLDAEEFFLMWIMWIDPHAPKLGIYAVGTNDDHFVGYFL